MQRGVAVLVRCVDIHISSINREISHVGQVFFAPGSVVQNGFFLFIQGGWLGTVFKKKFDTSEFAIAAGQVDRSLVPVVGRVDQSAILEKDFDNFGVPGKKLILDRKQV